MIDIVRKITMSNEVTIEIHSFEIDKDIITSLDLDFEGKSLLHNEPIDMNKDDLANFIQILIEAKNTGS